MNIQSEKLRIIEWISRIDDISIISKIQKIKEAYSGPEDWIKELSQEEIDSINRGLKDIEEGRVYSHESVRKIYEKFL